MLIFPAIDIKGSICVRMHKGDFETAVKVADDPLETAKSFKKAGAEWVHMVDLDGAVSGKRVNDSIFIKIAAETGLKVEVGGGIRTFEDIDYYLSNGISRVILGSIAVKDPMFVRQAVKKYGVKIAVGIDARDGKVAADGWVKTSEVDYIELARRMEDTGVKCIIFTDICRDGMLEGPNFLQLEALNSAVDCNVIASGGVTNIKDVCRLRDKGLYGTICGSSLYKGTLDLSEAIKECGEK